MSDALNVLVLDDDDLYLNETSERIRRIWERANIERCSSAGEAIEKVARAAVDVAILDLNMDKDLNTDWPKAANLKMSGGFIVYFSINSYRWKLLPPLIVLYTANPDLEGPLAPFMYRGAEEYLRGRPFIITRKDTTGKVMLEEALLDQERNRYRAYSHKLYDCEEVISSLERLVTMRRRNKPVEDWLMLGEIEIGPRVSFKQVFPALWHMTFNIWHLNAVRRDDLLKEARDLLAEYRWLPNLNIVLDREEAGGQVVHRLGKSCWTEFAEKAKGLPQATRANLLRDLKAESWDAPPWASAPWASDGGYEKWCDETEFHFKAAWREWGDLSKEERRGEKTLTGKTLIRIVKERLDENEGDAAEWAGAFSANGGRAVSFYMDPYVLAEAVNSVFAGEMMKRAEGSPPAWVRVVYRRGETDRDDTMALDLIGHGKKGFARELRERVNDPAFSYRRLASELSGWCDLWLYTHDEGDGQSVLGLNVSNPPAGEQREWPDRDSGDVPWGEVGCVVRWLFRIPPVPEKKEK